MGRRRDEASASKEPPLRKGPWMAEEDMVLIDYVKQHGPRNWSSIRHNGLLPRSGKSCRLRWVNKLKPDLKTGCKFSPEEERVVIDLQAQFGNKWARIATYLPGRTDNDVKNFWSTRKKRLARLMHAQSKARSQGNGGRGKSPAVFGQGAIAFQESDRSLMSSDEQNCLDQETLQLSSRETLLPLESLQFEAGVAPPMRCSERNPFMSSDAPLPLSLHLPEALPNLPLLPETHHLATDFDGVSFDQDPLAHVGIPDFDLLTDGLPCLDIGSLGDIRMEDMITGGPPDDFFDDLPVDVLDSLNSAASPSCP